MDRELFRVAYGSLNVEQRQAVDCIDGPVLVIAGPGTGKTQLLSARVANILDKTDIPASNILCLTFTESGAANMRERLTRFIGNAAYDVTIGTYHALGGEIIQRYPQYFMEHRLQQAIDELGRHQICSQIIARMSYQNPLKQSQHHIGDLIGTISEVKRALLSPDDLRAIATENLHYLATVSGAISDIFADLKRMPSKLAAAEPYFTQALEAITKAAPQKPYSERYGSLAGSAITELKRALESATELQKSTPLTAWKNNWLVKNADNAFALDGTLANKRLLALADVLEAYEKSLHTRGLYDFDDMIIRAVQALERNDELRFTLQEKYQYILLDEFQDTNAAQLRLVELLTNNPLSEGRPNVLAVGDDDQAIYAFQGARYSNMLDFYNLYRDVTVINLHTNYRSQTGILETAQSITSQMQERLFTHFDNIEKTLTATKTAKTPLPTIERTAYTSDVAERAEVSKAIHTLIDQGVAPHEIAILAPKHRLLMGLVPYLNSYSIPVHYEKRENILEAPLIQRIITMARLVDALQRNDTAAANAYWPEVLSGPEWRNSITEIWNIAWQVTDANQQTNWSKALLAAGDGLRKAALLHLGLARHYNQESLEVMLDYLVGTTLLDTGETDMPTVSSPIRDYYTSEASQVDNPGIFYDTLSQLTVLRAKLREHQAVREDALRLPDLLALVQAYEDAEQPMLHTSPYQQSSDAVQLMTVYKAKGLEFEHVFLLSCVDEIWGGSGQSNINRITLPANLAPIRHSGATEDERLRLLFVAITRAKAGLHITSHTQTYSGKATKRLRFLDEREDGEGLLRAYALPDAYQIVRINNESAPEITALELNWRDAHTSVSEQETLQALLQGRIAQYQLSPTHLNTFTDLIYGGPKKFFFNTILRFPSAPTTDSQYGNAVHATLEWVQQQCTNSGSLPSLDAIKEVFTREITSRKLIEPQLSLEIERGHHALEAYITQRGDIFKPEDRAEVNFKYEGVVIEGAHMGGKIDRLEIDTKQKTIIVVDYKTGKTYDSWKKDPKLHKYRQQLYCYKLLIENSRSFAGYTVQGGRLEFVEPDKETGRVNAIELNFTADDEARVRQLLGTLWTHVQELNFPDTAVYDASLRGITAFEDDLISGAI